MNVWGTWSLGSPASLLIVGSAAVYARGVWMLWSRGRGRGVGSSRVTCFFGGLLAVAVALVSPMDHAGGELLSAHMGQHLVLILVSAPLLVLGRPGLVALAALPPGWRRLAHRVVDAHAVRTATAALAMPLVAWFLHVGVVWAWHEPGAYQAAAEHPVVHWLQHASFLGTAVVFWWVALAPGSRRRLARGADVLYLVTAWIQSGALGALFTFAAVPIYPVYGVHAARVGIDPLKDQQIAGLIMWIPAGLVYLGIACALFVSWLKGIEAAAHRHEAAVDPAGVAAT